MSTHLSGLTRQRLRRVPVVLGLSALIGALYGIVVSVSPSPFVGALIGAVNGLVIGACIAWFELFALRTGSLRRLSAIPFSLLLTLKVAVYTIAVAAIIAYGPGEHLLGVAGRMDASTLARTVGFSMAVTLIFVVMLQAARLVGYRTFAALLAGRYHRPHAEKRFFLFVDVVGSTALAERLGALQVHRFLARIFTALAEPIAASRGEIYQYVGDEIVVTWEESDGRGDAGPLRCLFEMRSALARLADAFRARFDAEPELRAAVHFGEVITGEVGEERRAIVFHGDVMNVAARLEQATRETGSRFIASEEALLALGTVGELQCRDLGRLALRGRLEPIHAFAVDELSAPA
ncbi:MAG TPA: adenylate/guanylate cyclase domain-containing protein [Burkholderiales bacterium]|nr:adenylate/guanylate cyclase domain-containing protein [Burkholderiales bacterium]